MRVSPLLQCLPPLGAKNELKGVNESDLFPADADLSLNVTREMLILAQENDPSLTLCLASVVAAEENRKPVVFFLDNGVLMRRWSPDSSEINVADQVVVPKDYRPHILSLAHDSSFAGHLGVKKTYHRVLRNFFSARAHGALRVVWSQSLTIHLDFVMITEKSMLSLNLIHFRSLGWRTALTV